MQTRPSALVAAGILATLLTACADAPTGTPVRTPDGPNFVLLNPPNIGPAGLLVMTEEKVAVCKVFTGSVLAHPTAQFSVDFTGDYNTTVSFGLKDGECADLGFFGGPGVDVTVTETVIPNYSTSWTKQDHFVGPNDGPISAPTAGYVATGSAFGFRPPSSPAQGVLFVYTNAYEPPQGCTYTQGYWKTHSEHGPAPYDATWAQLANGANTPFYLSGQTYYQVFWTAPAGNPYYNLAHQYMAAYLNKLAGASQSVNAELASAHALFSTYTPAQVAALAKTSAVRAQFLALATTLDNYNNGVTGPGHCGA